MRIAVNTRFLLTGRLEGIGWFTYEVLKRLVARHPDWEFIFLFDRPYDPAFIFGDNVKPVVCRPPARHPLLWYAWFEVAVPRALRQHQADLFFSPDGYLSLAAPVPTVMVTHDIAHVHFPQQVPRAARAFYRYFVPRYLRKAREIVTVSQFTKADIVQHYGLPAEKITVVGNGCRDTFQPLQEETKQAIKTQYADGQDYFFYLGAVHPRKNIPNLIEAFDQFRQRTSSTVKLLIGGRFGWQTGAVRRAYENARYREDIVFLGYVSDEQLPLLTGAAVALTYVSVFEGFGVPILEAMRTDTPVITSQSSSMPEVAGEAALLVDPHAPLAIARAMYEVYNNLPLREKLIRAGRIQAIKFNWEQTTDIVEKVFLRALR